jgi:hypothetical protein
MEIHLQASKEIDQEMYIKLSIWVQKTKSAAELHCNYR